MTWASLFGKRPPNAGNNSGEALLNLAAPHADHRPSRSTKDRVIARVARLVAGHLSAPERSVRGRGAVVLRAAMPPTAVHEHGNAAGPEHDVWTCTEHACVNTIPKTRSPQRAT